MIRKITIAILLLAFPCSLASQSRSGTSRRVDNAIAAIRAIYQGVNSDIRATRLQSTIRRFEYDSPGEDTERRKYTDPQGHIRRYVRSGGSDDVAVTEDHYFDTAGNLRFLFITAGAINGTLVEYRLYFDTSGSRIRETRKVVKGPGYPFPDTWPDTDIVRDPASAFNAPVE
jgi:hypothetical protein